MNTDDAAGVEIRGPVLGRDHDTITGLQFHVTCPRGGHPMRLVQNADPRGWTHRERRAVLECTAPHCRHTVIVEVHLVDVGTAERAAATRRQQQSRARRKDVA